MLRICGLLALCQVFMFTGCTMPMHGTKTHPGDTTEPIKVSLSEAAQLLDLTIEESQFHPGHRYAHTSPDPYTPRDTFQVRENYKYYVFNTIKRTVEYPHVQRKDGELYFPLGMFRDMCVDLHRYAVYERFLAEKTGRTVGYEPTILLPSEQPAAPAPEAVDRSLDGLTVVIDAGHGGKDPGGIGIGGVYEKDIVLKVAALTQKLLVKRGATVLMTRVGDSYPELSERAGLANSKKADLFVSIHANIAFSDDVTGIETWYNDGGDRGGTSQRLAQAINAELVKRTGAPDRGARADRRGLHVLKYTTMPAALTELGFMSNADEAKKLSSPAYQARLAEGITAGIAHYAALRASISK